MTAQFVAEAGVATFTIIFLLGRFCMSWQIFIGYRNIIRSAHNRPHKAPCHTLVGRRTRRPTRAFFLYAAQGPRILRDVEKMKILIYLSNTKYVTDKRRAINHETRGTKYLLNVRTVIISWKFCQSARETCLWALTRLDRQCIKHFNSLSIVKSYDWYNGSEPNEIIVKISRNLNVFNIIIYSSAILINLFKSS